MPFQNPTDQHIKDLSQDLQTKSKVDEQKEDGYSILEERAYNKMKQMKNELKSKSLFHAPSLVLGVVLGGYIKGDSITRVWNEAVEYCNANVNSKLVDKIKPYFISSRNLPMYEKLFRSTMAIVIIGSVVKGLIKFVDDIRSKKGFSASAKNALGSAGDTFVDGAIASTSIAATGYCAAALGVTGVAATIIPVASILAGGVVAHHATKMFREKIGCFTSYLIDQNNTNPGRNL